MSIGLDHDEHQFIASGVLLARRGLLPYRDYAYFHTPNLVLVYALLFCHTHYLLLSARLLSCAAGFATVLMLAGAVFRTFGYLPSRWRLAASIAAPAFLVTNPLFLITSGYAWNHDVSEALLLGAALLFMRATRNEQPDRLRLLICGVLFGLAIGVRMTIAPAGAVFVGMLLADSSQPFRVRRRAILAFVIGLALGLFPIAIFLKIDAGRFYFGNFKYPALNTAYRQMTHYRGPMTPGKKILWFFERIVGDPGSTLLLVTIVGSLLVVRRWRRLSEHPLRRELTFLVLLMLFLLSGSFAPTPLFRPYFYVHVPFLILALAFLWAPVTPHLNCGRSVVAAVSAVLLICAVLAAPAYHPMILFRPQTWVPLQVHQAGIWLRNRNDGSGPILTLAPIFPAEGDLDFVAAYATGPFAMRVAQMLPDDQNRKYKLLGEVDLNRFFAIQTPRAVLVALEERPIEEPLFRCAARRRCPILEIATNRRTHPPTIRIVVSRWTASANRGHNSPFGTAKSGWRASRKDE